MIRQERVWSEVHPACVAGAFYPADPSVLRRDIRNHLHRAQAMVPTPPSVKGLIVPHAAYRYSGAIAGSGYACLAKVRDTVERVVVLGPSHHLDFRGLAACPANAFETPLGAIPLDVAAMEMALELPQVNMIDKAHTHEHSLEVQLPFLQQTLFEFRVVPLAVGRATCDEVAQVVELLWHGDETLFVVSSDLSHFQDYRTAQALDRVTSQRIVHLEAEQLTPQAACGCTAIRGFLVAARHHKLTAVAVDVRSSGDTSSNKRQVVGYGAYVFYA